MVEIIKGDDDKKKYSIKEDIKNGPSNKGHQMGREGVSASDLDHLKISLPELVLALVVFRKYLPPSIGHSRLLFCVANTSFTPVLKPHAKMLFSFLRKTL